MNACMHANACFFYATRRESSASSSARTSSTDVRVFPTHSLDAKHHVAFVPVADGFPILRRPPLLVVDEKFHLVRTRR